MSDGSYDPHAKRGTSAFALHGPLRQRKVHEVNEVPGDPTDHSSLRSELAGISEGIALAIAACAKHGVREGSLKAGLNNIDAVRALNYYLFKELQPSPTVACFDLYKDILFKCRTAPFDTSFF